MLLLSSCESVTARNMIYIYHHSILIILITLYFVLLLNSKPVIAKISFSPYLNRIINIYVKEFRNHKGEKGQNTNNHSQ